MTEMNVTTLSFYAHSCPKCGMWFNHYAASPVNLAQKICPLCGAEINEDSPIK
jgi:ribosomal protein S27AE